MAKSYTNSTDSPHLWTFEVFGQQLKEISNSIGLVAELAQLQYGPEPTFPPLSENARRALKDKENYPSGSRHDHYYKYGKARKPRLCSSKLATLPWLWQRESRWPLGTTLWKSQKHVGGKRALGTMRRLNAARPILQEYDAFHN